MQRTGWLRAIAGLGLVPGRSAKGIGRELLKLADQPMVPRSDEIPRLHEYARLRQLTERFENFDAVPAQDLWLCRSTESWSGSITKGSVEELAEWALVSGVIGRSMVTAPKGRLLLAAGDERFDSDWSKVTGNPFTLSPAEAVITFHTLWGYDADILGRWIRLLPSDRLVTRSEAGDVMASALSQLATDVGGPDGKAFAALAASMRDDSDLGRARGLRLHWVTPRLEQLVDIGMLHKPEPARYDVTMTRLGVRMREAADPGAPDWDVLRATYAGHDSELSDSQLHLVITGAYQRVKSGMGLADIGDIWTLAAAEALAAPQPAWLPKERVDEHLNGLISNGDATFNVDRFGRMKYVRIL